MSEPTAERDVVYDERTGLAVVDVQNDFADPKGSLCVPGEAVLR